MNIGTEVEYQTGVGEYGQGTVTGVVGEGVTITGYDWPVPLRDVIELSVMPAFNVWRAQWLELAEVAMSPSGMDKEDVFFFASDNDGNLRSHFKSGETAESSVNWHTGAVSHLPRFDNPQ